jgi:diketogulonate reductase-like aldo/keto reductase
VAQNAWKRSSGTWESQKPKERDVLVTAYSPLAQGDVVRDGTLRRIGEAHGKTASQVALRWLLEQPRVSPIPKAASHERRLENFDVLDFELTPEERAEIAGLAREERDG